MTPTGWLTDDFAILGALWIFGGVLLCVGVGAATGLLLGTEKGLGAGLLLWGLGNVAVAALTALYLWVDSTEVALHVARCEPLASSSGKPTHRLSFELERPGAAPRQAALQPIAGPCPLDTDQPLQLRVRRDALGAGAGPLAAEVVDDRPQVIAAVWAAFGSFGLLAGSLLWRHAMPRRT